MRDYGIVSPRFWIGETGRKLRQMPDAQRIAMYLLTAPMAEMTGVFYCPIATILNDVGAPTAPLEPPAKGLERGTEGACKGLRAPFEGASDPLTRGYIGALKGVEGALRALNDLDFCYYDFESEFVFVKEMARWQIADKLKPSDNRSKGLRKSVTSMPKSMMARFVARYNDDFSLGFDDEFVEKCREISRQKVSPSEAPSKALRSQEQEQEQEQDIYTRVSNETLSSANANAGESEFVLECTEGSKSTPAPKNGQTESETLSDKETTPAPNTGTHPAGAVAKRNPPLPYQRVIDLYNEKCTPALAAGRMTDKRREEIRCRWKDLQQITGAKTEEETLAEFGKFFDRVARSDFLTGRTGAFKADLPWLLGREKFEATLNGRYDNRQGAAIANNRPRGTQVLPQSRNALTRFTDDYYKDANNPDGTPNWGI